MCPTNFGSCSAIVGAVVGRSIVLVMRAFLSADGGPNFDPAAVVLPVHDLYCVAARSFLDCGRTAVLEEELDPHLLLWDMHRRVDLAAVPDGRTTVVSPSTMFLRRNGNGGW